MTGGEIRVATTGVINGEGVTVNKSRADTDNRERERSLNRSGQEMREGQNLVFFVCRGEFQNAMEGKLHLGGVVQQEEWTRCRIGILMGNSCTTYGRAGFSVRGGRGKIVGRRVERGRAEMGLCGNRSGWETQGRS